jgi:hypothetical protein
VKGNESAARQGRADVFRTLDKLDRDLSRSRFLMGSSMTAVDIRLAMTLLRYDAAYFHAFGLTRDDGDFVEEGESRHRGGILVDFVDDGYSHLRGYVRDVYSYRGGIVGETIRWESLLQYFRWTLSIHHPDQPLPDLARIIASVKLSSDERKTLHDDVVTMP